jgi:hypothetical protein
MICQIQAMSEAVENLSLKDRRRLRWMKIRHYFMESIKKVTTDPMIIRRKMGTKFFGSPSGHPPCSVAAGTAIEPLELIAPLDLKAGERVRIKSLSEIKKTLDHEGRYEGLGFMDLVMEKFCGKIFTVQKPIGLFFDERNWRMQKLRRVVILEGVYCELPAHNRHLDWAGCDRTCFLFWKEAWLERLRPDEGGCSD